MSDISHSSQNMIQVKLAQYVAGSLYKASTGGNDP